MALRPGGGPLLGRDRELALLSTGLAAVAEGGVSLILLSGEPGIGKTRLTEAFASTAEAQGAAVVRGRCWEWGGAPAFWPWVQALEAMGATLPTSTAGDPERSRFALFREVAALLATQSRARPLVVILDDLHAADAPSLLLLRFLTQSPGAGRILLLGTYRSVEARPAPDVAELLAALSAGSADLRLRGLGAPDVARFVESAAGVAATSPVISTLLDATAGNPFLLDAVVGSAIAAGTLPRLGTGVLPVPPGVRSSIRQRLGPLTVEAVRLLRGAAVVGRPFSPGVIGAVVGLDVERAISAVTEAVDEGLLVPADGRFAFVHALVAEALQDDLPLGERLALHRRIGEVLDVGPDAPAAELARHFLAAAPLVGAARGAGFAVVASARAMAVFAYEEAAAHCRRALAVTDDDPSTEPGLRFELLFALAEADLAAGRSVPAREAFLRAADVARADGAAEPFVRAALGVARTGEWGRADPERRRLLEEACAMTSGAGTELGAMAMAGLARDLWSDPSSRGRRDAMSGEALATARRLGGPPALSVALVARIESLWGPSSLDERLALTAELVALTRGAADLERAIEGHRWRGNVLLELGDLAAADAELEAYAQVAATLRRPQYLMNAAVRRTMRALLDGRFGAVEALADEAHAAGVAAGDPFADLPRLLALALLYEEQDRDDDLRGLLPALEEFVRRQSPTHHFARATLARARLRLGERDEASRELDALAARRFEDLPEDVRLLPMLASLAEVAAGLGDHRAGALLVPRLAPHARVSVMLGAGVCYGAAERYLGLAVETSGRPGDAIAHLEAALAMNLRMSAWPWVAHCQHDLSRALRPLGESERAGALLGEARRAAERMGMARLLREVGAPVATAVPRPAVATLRREGDLWTVAFDGKVVHLKHATGMTYLERLVRSPGCTFHALDLAGGRSPGGEAPADGALPALDARAKAAYRARVEALREELAEAERFADGARASRAREELDALTDQLARAVGLGGRDRQHGSAGERARISVTLALRRAVAAVAAAHPALGAHLSKSIETGRLCVYAPDPRAALDWTS